MPAGEKADNFKVKGGWETGIKTLNLGHLDILDYNSLPRIISFYSSIPFFKNMSAPEVYKPSEI